MHSLTFVACPAITSDCVSSWLLLTVARSRNCATGVSSPTHRVRPHKPHIVLCCAGYILDVKTTLLHLQMCELRNCSFRRLAAAKPWLRVTGREQAHANTRDGARLAANHTFQQIAACSHDTHTANVKAEGFIFLQSQPMQRQQQQLDAAAKPTSWSCSCSILKQSNVAIR